MYKYADPVMDAEAYYSDTEKEDSEYIVTMSVDLTFSAYGRDEYEARDNAYTKICELLRSLRQIDEYDTGDITYIERYENGLDL